MNVPKLMKHSTSVQFCWRSSERQSIFGMFNLTSGQSRLNMTMAMRLWH
jgi:hypothetical protein